TQDPGQVQDDRRDKARQPFSGPLASVSRLA
ncbi:MAG: hypothetical protein H6R45_366, partial [Proteobacteria bacterium]|nr:hypothetical protein [Pseudomonadota bacterium]